MTNDLDFSTAEVSNTVSESEAKEIEQARKQMQQELNSPEEQAMLKEIQERIAVRKKQLKSLNKNQLIKAIVHYELRLEQIQLIEKARKEQNETNSNSNDSTNNSDSVSEQKPESKKD